MGATEDFRRQAGQFSIRWCILHGDPSHSSKVALCASRGFVKFAQNSDRQFGMPQLPKLSLMVYPAHQLCILRMAFNIWASQYILPVLLIYSLFSCSPRPVCYKSSPSCAGSFYQQPPNRRNFAFPRYWSTGILEYWNTGVPEYWNTGVLEYWNTGVLEYWSTGVLEYLSTVGLP